MAGTGTTNISLDVLCDQRKKQMLFNNPQSRYTPANPYNGTFTKYQLDMRRKVEVLKYSNTNSSTKTNNLTKAQKLAQTLSGRSQSQGFQSKVITTLDANGNYNTVTVNYPDKLVISDASELDENAVKITGNKGYFTYTIIPNGQIVNCSADRLIPTPTSSCGIPGQIVNLIDDETVPLYNFTNSTINNAAYGNSEISNTNLWSLKSLNNVLLSTNVSSLIGTLLINPVIDNNQYTYTLQIPIGIYATNASGQNGSATIIINRLFLDVKYSGNVVPQNKTISLSNYSSNSPITITYSELPSSVNGYNYFAYIDTINVSNVVLTTNPGYVYDFYLTLDIDAVNSSYTTGFTNNTIFANYTNSILTSNISLLTVPILPPTNLSISKFTDTTIDISFSAPINNLNPVTGYTAFANGVGNGIASASANVIKVTGLSPTTTYRYLTVTAVYSNGTSTSSNVVSGTTLGFNPTQYSLVSANTTATSLTVSFVNGSNPLILSYYVAAFPDPNSNNNQEKVETITFNDNDGKVIIVPSGPITISGLVSGTKYNLKLLQYLSTGVYGMQINETSGTTLSPPPTELLITDINYTYLDLSYNNPNGSAPKGYKITSTPSSGIQVITNLSNTPYPTKPIRISGLLTGVTYTIVMTAIYNSVINSFNANSTSITQTTIFSAVTNLFATNISDVSFNLNYTPALGTAPFSYTVTITPKNGVTVITKGPITTLSNPYAITELTSGTTYDVVISSLYPAGTAISSQLTVTTIGTKSTALSIKNETINSFDVSFNVPSGNLPKGYYVTATPTTVLNSQTTVVYPTSPTLSSSNLITVPGLISGTTYSVKVTSVYDSGNQDSDSVSGNTLAYPPTNLEVVGQTYNTLSIRFTAPIGSVPIGYNANATPTTRNGLAVSIFNVSQNPIIISGLSSGTQYSIVISSYYDTGTYDSEPLTASTNSSPSTISGINTNTLTDPSTNAITVYISPPQSGTPPNSYNLIANPKTRRNSQVSVTLSNITPLISTTPYIMTGLISGTVYDVSLVAVYDTGNQTSATTISGTTLANPPTIESISNPTVNSLTVNYSAPAIGSLPINYTAIASPGSYNNGQSIITVTSIANNLRTYTIGNLVSATTYDISMIAVYDTGNFISTGSFSGTTTSNPPTSIIVTGTTASSIDLSYNPPIGSAPIGYFAIAKPTTTEVGQTSVTTSQTTSNQLTIRGLFAGTTYDISMVAVYSVGNQMSTISVSGNTLFSPPTITALNKNINDASTNAITVYFTPPSGTSPISYIATAVPDFTNNRQSIVDVTGLSNSITSFVIGNLISGTSYDISMSAVYATGYSGSNVLTGNTLFNAATF
jgi:hypothetical protein